MLPYWAIIKDSFREALYSYVLWGLILVLTSMLILLAPIGYSQQLTGDLRWGDVGDWRLMLFALKEGSESEGTSPSKHIWQKVNKPLRGSIDNLWKDLKSLEGKKEEDITKEEESRIGMQLVTVTSLLHRDLEAMLDDKDFYDKASWADAKLSEEAQELIKEDASKLSDKRLRRRNRLLLEAAYPVLVERSLSVSVRPTYAGRQIPQFPGIGAPAAMTKDAVVDWYRGYFSWMMNWPVTMLLVMVGIVATSAIMPRMLEPGSISLLLSKPVTRSMLYVSKFLGGCALMLLSATYIVVGVWLIAGFRVGIWDPKVFLCIPVFTFAFAVYFAVSAYVGVWTRSAIVAVLAVIAFWALVWMIGVTKDFVESGLIDEWRMVELFDTGDALLAVDESQRTFFWDDAASEWKETFKRPRMFGLMREPWRPMIYDEENRQLLSTTMNYATGMPTLAVGRDADAWALTSGIPSIAMIGDVPVPLPIVDLLVEPDGQVLIVWPSGLKRLTGSALSDGKPLDATSDLESLQDAGPKDGFEEGALAVAIDADSGLVVAYTGGVITTYKPDAQGVYQKVKRRELPDTRQKAATLGIGGDTLIVARDDGKLLVLDPRTLQERQSLAPEGETPARFIVAAPGGNWFAILFQNRRLWLFDAQNQRFRKANLWSQGDISAVAFNSAGTLLVADDIARVRELELPSLTVTKRFAPRSLPQVSDDWSVAGMRTYRWFITPLYNILPKPGELGWTLNYFVTGKKTLSAAGEGQANRDISSDRHLQRNPWTPIWSCAIFIVVMVALGCWMMEKREF